MSVDYHRHVTTQYSQLTQKIIKSYTPTPENEVEAAAAVHNNLYRELKYDTRGPDNQRPFRNIKQTIIMGGNCQEKGAALASLLAPYQDIEVLLYGFDSPNGDGHLIPLIKFKNRDINKIDSILRQYYRKSIDTPTGPDYYTFYQGGILADPSIRNLGRIGWLKDDGFIQERPDGTEYFHSVQGVKARY